MMQVAKVALIMLSGLSGVRSETCMEGDCLQQQGEMLMQKVQKSGALHPKPKQKARVDHAGTVNLLLAEMNEMIETHGQDGIPSGGIEHIHSIKALIDDTILPTIHEEVEKNKEDLQELYDAIVACEDHANKTTYKSGDHIKIVDEVTTKVRQCEEKEDIMKKRTKKACTTLNHTRWNLYLPADETYPAYEGPVEEMIKYLDFMGDFYCGSYEEFYHEWQECENYEENYTITHEECQLLQKEFEETSCTWTVELEQTCTVFETCWTTAVQAYNDRVKQILDLQKSRIEEYEGASNIQCLWSAWIYEYMPCTVNKTRVKECHEWKPNVSNVTIEYPKPPPPPECVGWDKKRSGTGAGAFEICSEDWLRYNFGDLNLDSEILDNIRDNCIPCKDEKWTSAPVVTKHVHSYNAQHAGGNNYMKLSSGSACDSFVETDDPNVFGIKFIPMDRTSKYMVEIVFNSTSYGMVLEGGSITVEKDGSTWEEIGVGMYSEMDKITMTVIDDKIDFKNSRYRNTETPSFATYTLDEDLVSGFGKMTMCGAPSMEGQVEFLLTQ